MNELIIVGMAVGVLFMIAWWVSPYEITFSEKEEDLL